MQNLLNHINTYHAVMDGTSTRRCLEFLDGEVNEIHRIAVLMPEDEKETWLADDMLKLKDAEKARPLLLARLEALKHMNCQS